MARVEHLLGRYGSLVDEVLDLIEADPTLASRCRAPTTTCEAEVVYAVTHEGARHLEDVLARRTRISIEAWDRGVSAAETVARLMGDQLGWGEAERDREVAFYRERVQAERNSQTEPDDQTADRARLVAPDVVRRFGSD